MATDTLPADLEDSDEPQSKYAHSSLPEAIVAVLKPLASLKLTVTLFALAVFLIFAGTLAQARHDISWVQNHIFFSFFAWIDLKTFFPPAWFSDQPNLLNIAGGIPFPGGFLIGSLMLVNLLAAHSLRFKSQARGNRLLGGLALITIGCAATWLVIVAGPDKDGSQATAPLDWITLWKLFLVGLACGCVGIAWMLFQLDSKHKLERAVLGGVGAIMLVLLGYLLFHVDPQFLNPSAMRILWQLIKAEFAAVVLLVGCILAFKKRAGIVLLHAGVALIILNQLLVYCLHKEEQMTIAQGQTSNYAQDIRELELAVIDKSTNPTDDVVTVMPEQLLRKSLDNGKAISDSRLPFNLRLVKLYENSALDEKAAPEKNPADTGRGKNWPIFEAQPLTGADAGEAINTPSAFVELTDKAGKSLGTYLVTTILTTEQPVEVDGKTYQIALRFQRDYKPYTMHLNEVRGDMYLGTSTPRNYSSDLQLVDPTHDVDRRVGIRMNEPLRYGGETFYQSEYDDGHRDGIKKTTLQVVSNFGWMIPYVACMIVVTGLLFQFGQTLIRFLRRRDSGKVLLGWGTITLSIPALLAGVLAKRYHDKRQSEREIRRGGQPISENVVEDGFHTTETDPRSVVATIFPIAVVSLAVALLVYASITPSSAPSEMDLYAVGKLPLVSGGRVEPLDTLARNTLRLLSNKESYLEFSGVTVDDKDGTVSVAKITEGSPAQQAGLKVKDEIVEINGHPVNKMLPGEAAEKIDDPGGGKIELSIASGAGVPRTVIIKRQYQPAIKWLLDLIARPTVASQQHVFRVDNLDVLNMLGLKRREYYRYSLDEINRDPARLDDAGEQLRKQTPEAYGVYDKKLSELFDRLMLYGKVARAFLQHPLPPIPTPEDFQADPEGTKERVEQIAKAYDKLNQAVRELMRSHPPLAVPVVEPDDANADKEKQANSSQWEPYIMAWLEKYSDEIQRKPVNSATVAWENIFDAYAKQDAAAFNKAVAGYSAELATKPPPQLVDADTSFESWYMHFSPFSYCMWIYLAAGCLAALAWLGWSGPLNRTAFWLILITFVVHTFALWARMHISGRPPVTNLYSTAIFIGWGAVLAGIILEAIFRLGFGNIVAGAAGFLTLLIADKLTLLLEPSTGGDTIGVMQAVLDTQFWLATHVTVVNMGYMATYVAGLLGIIYVIARLVSPTFEKDLGKTVARMTYGTICFAMFFSFLGTVLGGLWADDSWGRFWGWDPKENGALIIVIWNALVLHARWDGMIKDRGLAVLAIGGNIVTSWSYFGVNQLGVGLHSYGFTEGVLLALALVVVVQLALIALGLLPVDRWRGHKSAIA